MRTVFIDKEHQLQSRICVLLSLVELVFSDCLVELDPPFWALVSNLGFFKFQIFRFSILEIFVGGEIFSKIMLVRYRGINNKGVLERPWTKWRVLKAISTTLKCQFTGKCKKVDFSMPCTTKSAETLQVAPYSRCGPPGNP